MLGRIYLSCWKQNQINKYYKNSHPKYDLNWDYITAKHSCLTKSSFKIISANVHSLTNSFNPERKETLSLYTDIISFIK